jgi:CHASE3 domain sensor protein
MFYLIILFITILISLIFFLAYNKDNNENNEDNKEFTDLLSNFDDLIEEIENRFNKEIHEEIQLKRHIETLKQENANIKENKKGILEGVTKNIESELESESESDSDSNTELKKKKKNENKKGELEGINTEKKKKEITDLKNEITKLKKEIDSNISDYNNNYTYEKRIENYTIEKIKEFIDSNPGYTNVNEIINYFLETERDVNNNIILSYKFKTNIKNLKQKYKKFKTLLKKYNNVINITILEINIENNKFEEYDKFIYRLKERYSVIQFINSINKDNIEAYLKHNKNDDNLTGGNMSQRLSLLTHGVINTKKEYLKFNNKKYLIKNDNISFYINIGKTKKYLCKIENNYKFC